MSSLNNVTIDYLSHIQRTRSDQQVAATSQALSLFFRTLSAHHAIPRNLLTTVHLGVGGFEHFLSWLQSNRSIETEHLYSRAILDFMMFISRHLNTLLPINEINTYLTTHRRKKTHQIIAPPVAHLNKIIQLAKTAPVPANVNSDRDTLRFLRDRAFILTLAATGYKLSFLCDLKVHTINSLTADFYSCPIPFLSALDAYLTERQSLDELQVLSPPNLPVFARHDKRAGVHILSISRWTAANIINYWVNSALTDVEIEHLKQRDYVITSQSFRDSFILDILLNSDDLLSVMASAGHADLTTTRRYLAVLNNTALDQETNI